MIKKYTGIKFPPLTPKEIEEKYKEAQEEMGEVLEWKKEEEANVQVEVSEVSDLVKEEIENMLKNIMGKYGLKAKLVKEVLLNSHYQYNKFRWIILFPLY